MAVDIKVLFFGKFREESGVKQVLKEAPDLHSLLEELKGDYPFLQSHPYLLARNQEIVRDNQSLQDHDEIALMPPFAGG